jgi:hypothetical protein
MTRAGEGTLWGTSRVGENRVTLKKIQLGVFFGWVSLFFLLDAGCLLGLKFWEGVV